eukprot:c38973_g1_i1 orf=2-151(+)
MALAMLIWQTLLYVLKKSQKNLELAQSAVEIPVYESNTFVKKLSHLDKN